MNRFEKVRRIGKGSFGVVWLVRNKDTRCPLVVKEINISALSPKEQSDAVNEARVLSQLSHPNIIKYYESFEENGVLHIVMEYADGGDLFQYIQNRRGNHISEEQILDWFVQACLALKHVHDRKILHRDLKTQNIFLTRNNVVKLGDFGIARVLKSTIECARTAIGTPYYLSPEICEDKPYQCFYWPFFPYYCSWDKTLYPSTLKHAFDAQNLRLLIVKILRGIYSPIPPKYSNDLRNLIAQMLKRLPSQRPSVNTILTKRFIQLRIESFLSQTLREREFSHTVIHSPQSSQEPMFKRLDGEDRAISPSPATQRRNIEKQSPTVTARRKSLSEASPSNEEQDRRDRLRMRQFERKKAAEEAKLQQEKARQQEFLERVRQRQRNRAAAEGVSDQLVRQPSEAPHTPLQRRAVRDPRQANPSPRGTPVFDRKVCGDLKHDLRESDVQASPQICDRPSPSSDNREQVKKIPSHLELVSEQMKQLEQNREMARKNKLLVEEQLGRPIPVDALRSPYVSSPATPTQSRASPSPQKFLLIPKVPEPQNALGIQAHQERGGEEAAQNRVLENNQEVLQLHHPVIEHQIGKKESLPEESRQESPKQQQRIKEIAELQREKMKRIREARLHGRLREGSPRPAHSVRETVPLPPPSPAAAARSSGGGVENAAVHAPPLRGPFSPAPPLRTTPERFKEMTESPSTQRKSALDHHENLIKWKRQQQKKHKREKTQVQFEFLEERTSSEGNVSRRPSVSTPLSQRDQVALEAEEGVVDEINNLEEEGENGEEEDREESMVGDEEEQIEEFVTMVKNMTDVLHMKGENDTDGEESDEIVEEDDRQKQPDVHLGVTAMLPHAREQDSLAYRIECLRESLEKELGFDRFIDLYQRLKDIPSDTDDPKESSLVRMLDSRLLPYFAPVNQLIHCEIVLFERQNQE